MYFSKSATQTLKKLATLTLILGAAVSQASVAPVFMLKNTLRKGQVFTLTHWDFATRTSKQLPLIGGQVLEVFVNVNAVGRVESLEIQEFRHSRGMPTKKYVLLRARADRPFSECLVANGREYLCFSVADLSHINDRTSPLSLRVLPSWVRYSKPRDFHYTLRWNDRKIPVGLEQLKTRRNERTMPIKTLLLHTQVGWFLQGILGVTHD